MGNVFRNRYRTVLWRLRGASPPRSRRSLKCINITLDGWCLHRRFVFCAWRRQVHLAEKSRRQAASTNHDALGSHRNGVVQDRAAVERLSLRVTESCKLNGASVHEDNSIEGIVQAMNPRPTAVLIQRIWGAWQRIAVSRTTRHAIAMARRLLVMNEQLLQDAGSRLSLELGVKSLHAAVRRARARRMARAMFILAQNSRLSNNS